MTAAVSIVVPTLGRPSLVPLLSSLAGSAGPLPDRLVLVDDRPEPGPLPEVPPTLAGRTQVVRSGGRGPAAARNAGWRAAVEAADGTTAWVAFVDDDVVVSDTWLADLGDDLGSVPDDVGGVQGRVVVPLPADRAPTDWERGTAGLQDGWWITADMAYRHAALHAVGGFDERFPRAYREDADLALRVTAAGWRLERGQRTVTHPVRPAGAWASARQQAGNADDALMRRVHGGHWRELARAPRGRRRSHVAVTATATAALGLAAGGRPVAAGAAAAGWLAGTLRFAWARIAPGPRDRREIGRMLATSAAIPPLATWHSLRGAWRWRRAQPWPTPTRAVLFDRDGTLVHDVPYNGDPARVAPMPGAVDAVRRLRGLGVRVGVVTNQSGIGRGTLTEDQVAEVHARIEEIFGPFDVWQVCPHAPEAGCGCRKPRPGMVLAAAASLGVPTESVVVIGDIGADVAAAQAAGARAVLVPTAETRPDEVAAADAVAPDITTAVRMALAGPPVGTAAARASRAEVAS